MSGNMLDIVSICMYERAVKPPCHVTRNDALNVARTISCVTGFGLNPRVSAAVRSVESLPGEAR
jgi:hypothetical protein